MIRVVVAATVAGACYLLRDITIEEAVGVALFLIAMFVDAVDASLRRDRR